MKLRLIPLCLCMLCICSGFMQAQAASKDCGKYPSLDIMLGEMILVGFDGETLADDAVILQNLRDGKAGGVILFERKAKSHLPHNIRSPEQTKALIAQLRKATPRKIFVSVDQEGGAVQRLSKRTGFQNWPSAQTLGFLSVPKIYASSLAMGQMIAELGFNLNFAPVVDLHHPDSAAIGRLGRAFSEKPDEVAVDAMGFVQGMNDAGVVPVLKHFPGHGTAVLDTHDAAADASRTWSKEELIPFAALIKDNFQGMIMTAHIGIDQFGSLPSTLSHGIITAVLRERLGWDGVVISDDMQMKAISDYYALEDAIYMAVQAGVDILLFGNNLMYDEDIAQRVHTILGNLVQNGDLSEERIRASWKRIAALKHTLP